MPRIEKKSIVIQPRDLAFLQGLFESRVMTSAHATALYFDGHKEAAKKRLQRLKAESLISERPRRPYEPAVLKLAPQGLSQLRNAGILDEYPRLDAAALRRRSNVSPATIAHELAVMDVKVAFVTQSRKSGKILLNEFSTWPRLHSFMVPSPRGHVEVKPDGFICVHTRTPDGGNSEHIFFLELDRSTESLQALSAKVRAYRRHGYGRNLRQRVRVLFVFRSEHRRNNFLEALTRTIPDTGALYVAATIGDVTRDSFGPIWLSAAEYRSAIGAIRRGTRVRSVRLNDRRWSLFPEGDRVSSTTGASHKKATSEEVA